MTGAIIVDKPAGWTSHDVVNKLRRLLRIKRIGHLGTLDPLATGVLPIVVGSATRLSQFFTKVEKVYEAVIRFGYATDTYDRAGTPISPEAEPAIEREDLERELQNFRGEFEQKPPPVSAKKIDGVRAYELARKKVAVELKPVPVQVYELTLLEWNGLEARVHARCSAGTYLRSIAHDLGQALGCGAHLKDLRRTASGEFRIDEAYTMPELEFLAGAGRISEALIPAAGLLPQFPSVYVEPATESQIRQGRTFAVSPFRAEHGSRYVKALSRDGELIAIGEAKLPNLYHPVVVLASTSC